jgi:hypothetical protein
MEVMKLFIKDTKAKACRRSRKLMEAKLDADSGFVQ